MSDDLVAFLKARLDDGKKRQADISESWHSPACESMPDVLHPDNETGACNCGVPAHVLADIEAKLRIVKEYEDADTVAQFPDFDGGLASGLEDALRLLALPYADHPDYREEWRPVSA